MNNVYCLALAAALTASGSLSAFALSYDGYDRDVEIVNRTPYTIRQLDASNVREDDWFGVDFLGEIVIPPGESVVVTIDDGLGYCRYDLRAVLGSDRESIAWNVNVCSSSRYVFR